VMGMAQCRRLAGKPSDGGYILIDPLHPQMRSMTWNCYRSSAQRATRLSCHLLRPLPPQHHGRRIIYQCTHCPTYFSATKQPLLAGLQTPVSVIWQVVKARTEGRGLHAAARTFEKAKKTILAWERKLRALHQVLFL
jgi:hypothetical protein